MVHLKQKHQFIGSQRELYFVIKCVTISGIYKFSSTYLNKITNHLTDYLNTVGEHNKIIQDPVFYTAEHPELPIQ